MLSLREWAFAHVEKISKEESSSLSLLRSIGILLGAEERETASPHFSPKISNRAYVYNWISKSSCYFKAILFALLMKKDRASPTIKIAL